MIDVSSRNKKKLFFFFKNSNFFKNLPPFSKSYSTHTKMSGGGFKSKYFCCWTLPDVLSMRRERRACVMRVARSVMNEWTIPLPSVPPFFPRRGSTVVVVVPPDPPTVLCMRLMQRQRAGPSSAQLSTWRFGQDPSRPRRRPSFLALSVRPSVYKIRTMESQPDWCVIFKSVSEETFRARPSGEADGQRLHQSHFARNNFLFLFYHEIIFFGILLPGILAHFSLSLSLQKREKFNRIVRPERRRKCYADQVRRHVSTDSFSVRSSFLRTEFLLLHLFRTKNIRRCAIVYYSRLSSAAH